MAEAKAQKLTGLGVRLARTEFTSLPLQSGQACLTVFLICSSQEGKKEKKVGCFCAKGSLGDNQSHCWMVCRTWGMKAVPKNIRIPC